MIQKKNIHFKWNRYNSNEWLYNKYEKKNEIWYIKNRKLENNDFLKKK